MSDRVIIEIRKPFENTQAKYEAADSTLRKALGMVDKFPRPKKPKEITPFRAVRELLGLSLREVERDLYRLHTTLCAELFGLKKAEGGEFRWEGRTYVNPKTGKPLTVREWKLIRKKLTSALSVIYEAQEDRLVKEAMALGKILATWSVEDAIDSRYKNVDLSPKRIDRTFQSQSDRRTLEFAQQHAAENIVELTNRQYRKIHDTIIEAQKNRLSPRELETELFEDFGEMNRDWYRIATTEIHDQANNGRLLARLDKRTGREPVFMKGVSGAEACNWCKERIDNTVVVLLDTPPTDGSDTYEVNGENYQAIWPGKSNVGRKKADWWVSAGTQHPHCIIPGQEVASFLPNTVTQGFYKGRVIEISTSYGRRLTVTENHPILTPRGFVAAKFLREGDEVFYSSDTEGMVRTVSPDYYQRPTAIEDFYTAAKHSSSVPSGVMPVSPEDFYGDGRGLNSEIDVVNAYGLLGSDLEALLIQHRLQERFIFVDGWEVFASLSTRDFKGARFDLSSTSNLGLLDSFFSSFGSQRAHVDGTGRPMWTNSHALFVKTITEGGSTHSNLSSEFLDRFSVDISRNNFRRKVSVDGAESPGVRAGSITHIRQSSYEGPVYDLCDDVYGLYMVNGTIVKNCGCQWIEYTPGFEQYHDMLKQAMDDATVEWYNQHPGEAAKKLYAEEQGRQAQRDRLKDLIAEKRRQKRLE